MRDIDEPTKIDHPEVGLESWSKKDVVELRLEALESQIVYFKQSLRQSGAERDADCEEIHRLQQEQQVKDRENARLAETVAKLQEQVKGLVLSKATAARERLYLSQVLAETGDQVDALQRSQTAANEVQQQWITECADLIDACERVATQGAAFSRRLECLQDYVGQHQVRLDDVDRLRSELVNAGDDIIDIRQRQETGQQELKELLHRYIKDMESTRKAVEELNHSMTKSTDGVSRRLQAGEEVTEFIRGHVTAVERQLLEVLEGREKAVNIPFNAFKDRLEREVAEIQEQQSSDGQRLQQLWRVVTESISKQSQVGKAPLGQMTDLPGKDRV